MDGGVRVDGVDCSVFMSVEFADGPRGSSGADCGERSSTADPGNVRHSVSDSASDWTDTDLAADGARQGVWEPWC